MKNSVIFTNATNPTIYATLADWERIMRPMDNFKIIDYKTYDDKVVILKFDDGTQEKAVCADSHEFDFERGVEVCVLKHVLGSAYRTALKKSMKQIKEVDEDKKKEKEAKEIAKRRKVKAEKRKAKKRERRIAEMKEAYLSAMYEYHEDSEKAS